MKVSCIIIGHNIKAARTSLHLTQEQAARKAGISTSHLGQIERGELRPSMKLLSRIADALNTSVHALLQGCIPDKEKHPAIFESDDPQTQEYGEYALLILDEYREQIKRYYEELGPKTNLLH